MSQIYKVNHNGNLYVFIGNISGIDKEYQQLFDEDPKNILFNNIFYPILYIGLCIH